MAGRLRRARGLVLAALACAVPALADNATPWLHPERDHPSPWGLLDINRGRGSARPWRRTYTLTGDWGGWRSELEDEYGITLFGNNTSEAAGNPLGGRSQGVTYTHNVSLALLLDLEKALGIPETRFIVSASNRAGSSLSRDHIGNVYAVQQIYGSETTRLVLLALGVELFDNRLDLVAGRLNGLDDFAASPLYCNAQNLAFCGNPLSIPSDVNISSYPNTAWGFRARWTPHPAVYAMRRCPRRGVRRIRSADQRTPCRRAARPSRHPARPSTCVPRSPCCASRCARCRPPSPSSATCCRT